MNFNIEIELKIALTATELNQSVELVEELKKNPKLRQQLILYS